MPDGMCVRFDLNQVFGFSERFDDRLSGLKTVASFKVAGLLIQDGIGMHDVNKF